MEAERRLAPSREASVVLDIGGEIGALVVHAPLRYCGSELEVEALGGPGGRTHAEVRFRETGGGQCAAVYPALREGRYRLVASGQEFEVAGAAVTEVALS